MTYDRTMQCLMANPHIVLNIYSGSSIFKLKWLYGFGGLYVITCDCVGSRVGWGKHVALALSHMNYL